MLYVTSTYETSEKVPRVVYRQTPAFMLGTNYYVWHLDQPYNPQAPCTKLTLLSFEDHCPWWRAADGWWQTWFGFPWDSLPFIVFSSRLFRKRWTFSIFKVYSEVRLWCFPWSSTPVPDVVHHSCILSALTCDDKFFPDFGFSIFNVGWEPLTVCRFFCRLLTCFLIRRYYHDLDGSLCPWTKSQC